MTACFYISPRHPGQAKVSAVDRCAHRCSCRHRYLHGQNHIPHHLLGAILFQLVLETAAGLAAIHAACRGADARQSAQFAFANVVGAMSASGEQFTLAHCQQPGETGEIAIDRFSDHFVQSLCQCFIYISQGMYTQSAEQLWKKITEHVSDSKYSIKQTILGLDSFIKTFQISK